MQLALLRPAPAKSVRHSVLANASSTAAILSKPEVLNNPAFSHEYKTRNHSSHANQLPQAVQEVPHGENDWGYAPWSVGLQGQLDKGGHM